MPNAPQEKRFEKLSKIIEALRDAWWGDAENAARREFKHADGWIDPDGTIVIHPGDGEPLDSADECFARIKLATLVGEYVDEQDQEQLERLATLLERLAKQCRDAHRTP